MSFASDAEIWRERLDDILEAADRIASFLDGCGKAAFLADPVLISAVTYQLFIIGEASRHCPASAQERTPSIPWRQMRGMRNIIAHEYGKVDPLLVWDVATTDLAPLRLALLAERDYLSSC